MLVGFSPTTIQAAIAMNTMLIPWNNSNIAVGVTLSAQCDTTDFIPKLQPTGAHILSLLRRVAVSSNRGRRRDTRTSFRAVIKASVAPTRNRFSTAVLNGLPKLAPCSGPHRVHLTSVSKHLTLSNMNATLNQRMTTETGSSQLLELDGSSAGVMFAKDLTIPAVGTYSIQL
mmetsp:Transcript_21756/g.47453  ORF Transcript_21756/g.47453 Transcript_21756/m.47453 type:complete len:172 (-) Transcript_21756:380-895(-)